VQSTIKGDFALQGPLSDLGQMWTTSSTGFTPSAPSSVSTACHLKY